MNLGYLYLLIFLSGIRGFALLVFFFLNKKTQLIRFLVVKPIQSSEMLIKLVDCQSIMHRFNTHYLLIPLSQIPKNAIFLTV